MGNKILELELSRFDLQLSRMMRGLSSDSRFTPSEKEKRLNTVKNDELAFAKIYFPQIFSEPWNDIHRHIAKLEMGKFTVSGARRFGKSAFTYIAKVVKTIVEGKREGVINISLRTLYNARERTSSIVSLIIKNKLLCYDYDVNISQNKKEHYIINGIHLVASGVQTGLRAILDENFNRFILSVNDDLYNVYTVYSENDNKKVYDFITSEVYGQMEEDGLCITLGNSITADCPIRLLADEYPDKHFSLPATDENGSSNWQGHSLFTNRFWELKRKEIPHEVWMGEYMDKPVERGEVFDLNWIIYSRVNFESITAVITVIDPGYGESPTACRKGVVTLAALKSGELMVLDIYLRNDSYPEVFDYVNRIRTKFPKWKSFLFENDFNQWQICKPYYENWCKENNNSLPVMHFTAKELKTEFFAADKESRVLNLVYPHQNGEILYNEELTGKQDFKEFRGQFTGFGKKGIKVDGLDALASAYILIKRYKANSNFKTLKKREFNNLERKWLNRL